MPFCGPDELAFQVNMTLGTETDPVRLLEQLKGVVAKAAVVAAGAQANSVKVHEVSLAFGEWDAYAQATVPLDPRPVHPTIRMARFALELSNSGLVKRTSTTVLPHDPNEGRSAR